VTEVEPFKVADVEPTELAADVVTLKTINVKVLVVVVL
jgi:hypothetical protein